MYTTFDYLFEHFGLTNEAEDDKQWKHAASGRIQEHGIFKFTQGH